MNKKTTIQLFLSVLGAVGVIGTAVMAVKETPKAIESLNELKKNGEPKKLDYIKWFVKSYKKTLVVGTGTIGSITASTVISQKEQNALLATAAFFNAGYNKIKKKTKEVFGEDAEKKIISSIVKDSTKNLPKKEKDDDRVFYYEEHIGTFLAKPVDVAYAYADLNQRFQCDEYGRQSPFGVVTLHDFVELADIELVGDSKNRLKELEMVWRNTGWDIDQLYNRYEYCWIHMCEDIQNEDADNPVHILTFEESPITLPYDPKLDPYSGEYENANDIRTELRYPDDADPVSEYCANDVLATEAACHNLKEEAHNGKSEHIY